MARARKRITRVTTKTGDSGQTSLADGSRVSKSHPRMHAIGAVDELNGFVGLLLTELTQDNVLSKPCRQIQQELFDIGAYLATLGATPCPDPDWVENEVARLNEQLPALTEFVIPGGTRAAALAHVCRTTCRRAERHLWKLEEETAGSSEAAGSSGAAGSPGAAGAARYANRLSDLFFVMARTCNAEVGAEPQWRGSQGEPADIGE
ncbi:MAG: cob(I)yrinic acid a,c-diamide adenosyltransferase [Gammaproteobacteria bacterium]|nr:cob(I)yrinic acid a,c-diamide adenosyltransferase [Gammaproteobacteria bacterium]